ncbi:hypothetical protein QYM36_018135 [Artemia franciscana]|uniref:Reverse transcriptase domain-containing protein n=1 Tax=Artemia franciscana TaxID=6661 RepID=A0AA88L0R2_ARTSF|nr:hypothetical protein QYM36_018135 [Artemia franciscana]
MLLDFVSAFDSVTRKNLWQITVEDETETFSLESDVKDGCILPSVLFNYCIDWILERALSCFDGDAMGLGIHVSDLEYVDDIEALVVDPATAHAHFPQLLGMKIETAKTKVIDISI